MKARLRVAMIAGELGQSGAEKQLYYVAQALINAGVDVRVYCLTQGEYFETYLQKAGVPVEWVGHEGQPFLRVARILQKVLAFRPHLIYSTHFYTNLYAAIAGRLTGTLSIGSIRSDGHHEVNGNGRWGMALLKMTHVLVANSHGAAQNAVKKGVRADNVYTLPNVIDLAAFDRKAAAGPSTKPQPGKIAIVTVARLIKAKRLDRFISVIAEARRTYPQIYGIIAGDGPLKDNLVAQARGQGLLPDGIRFLGYCDNVPALLKGKDIFALTSDYEGFPNAILEAMAAGLPVVTTPAGEAGRIVVNRKSGFVVPPESLPALVHSIVELSGSAAMRQEMGRYGRQLIEERHTNASLGNAILELFREIALRRKNQHLLSLLDELHTGEPANSELEEAILG